MLQTAAQAELVGTKRWFLLQNLRAFAAFRIPRADTAQGFEAYEAIFDHASDAAKVKAEYPLRQSILEFVDSVPGKFNDFGLSKDAQTKELLLKAWTAYAVALSAPLTGAKVAEPDWKRALVKSESLEAFVPAVEKVIADPAVPKTFGLLITAASVIAPKDPDKALALWQQAKPLLPQEAGKTDVNQAARLYVPLVELLAARGRLPEAVENQQEFVQLTGRGQAKLMLLLRTSGDAAATEKALAALRDPGANEKEIGEAASGLFKLARDAKAPDAEANEQAVTLLKSYLAAPRTRDLAEELSARLALGNFYLRQHQFSNATQILTLDAALTKEKVSPRARGLLRSVESMKAQTQKASEEVLPNSPELLMPPNTARAVG